MVAVLIGLLLMSLQVVLGWIGPGLLLELRCSPWRREPTSLSALLSRAAALGALYLTGQFFLAMLAMSLLGVPPLVTVAVKYAVDLVLLVVLLSRARQDLKQVFQKMAAACRDPATVVLVTLAVAYGAMATYRCPYALDNAALGWTNRLVAGEAMPWIDSQGSPAYIGLLFFPCQLVARWIPGPTMAATLKLPLCLLAALAVRRLTGQLSLRQPGLAALAYFIILSLSFFGLYGLFETAKETVFGITFLMLYVAELIDDGGRPDSWASRAGLMLSAAFGFGAVTIPYALVFTAAFLWFALGKVKPFDFTWRLLAWTALPLVPSISAMTKLPLWLASLLVGTVGIACFALRRLPAADGQPSASAWRLRTAPLLLLGVMLGVYLALPVKYTVSYPPLDGQTTFADLLFRLGGIRREVVAAGLVGLLLVFMDRRYARNPALLAFAVFPFAALLPTLVAAHLQQFRLPFHPQHLWDLAKDIPNWCYGFYFGLLALVVVDSLSRQCASWQSRLGAGWPWLHAASLPMLMALVILGSKAVKSNHPRLVAPAHFTRIGGHQDADLAEVLERLTRPEYPSPRSGLNANQAETVLVSKTSAVNGRRHELRMYGIRVRPDFDLSDAAQVASLATALPARLVARRDEVLAPAESGAWPFTVEEIEQVTSTDSIFLIRAPSSPEAPIVAGAVIPRGRLDR